MTLTQIESPWWLLIILPVAAAAAWWMYRSTRDTMPGPVRWGLMSLRTVSLCLAAWLLLQPILKSVRTLTYPPIVAWLQDDSESLVIQRDSSFIKEDYPLMLTESMDLLSSGSLELDGYHFGNELHSGLMTDSLLFQAEGTNVSRALRETGELYQNLNLGAIVLASDGIITSGSNPLYQLDRLGVPVYTLLLGDTTEQKDVRIKEVLYNDIAYLNTEMPVKVRIQSVGIDLADLRVSLRSGGKILKTESLRLGQNRPQGEVDFLIQPQAPGLQSFEVIVTRLDGEITYRNNNRRFFVNVLETRVKIALFAGSPHPDIGALKQAFEREEGYELVEFVSRSPGQFYGEPSTNELKDVDLIMLHNFPASSADASVVVQIAETIEEENKPLMAFLGTKIDLQTLQPLYKFLAASPRNLNPRSEEIIANFSQSYRQHSTYTFDDRWISWANSSPPLYRPQAAWQSKADASVLATAKIRNIPLDYPVYLLQNYLGRKNMVFLAENIWRMRAHAFVEEESFEPFDAWLFNNVKWLMVSDDNRTFRVDPSRKVFSGRESVSFTGQAYDDSYNPIQGAEINLLLTDPEGNETSFYLNETDESQYFLEIGSLPAGRYRYSAEGRKDNIRIGQDRGEFSIGRSGVEHISLQADQNLMKQLSIRSGGKFFYADQINQLTDALMNDNRLLTRRDSRPSRVPLRQLLWPLILLLSLLSVEWVLRKINSQP